mmetsp:Transcript_6971/g.19655  ORF Transcript_6971/g.19655 Transcript_6971/m.19655 type:complete len:201 (-) Transcript_6971:38-640(-)
MVLAKGGDPDLPRAVDTPLARFQVSGNQLQQGRLADAVVSHNRQAALHVEPEVEVLEESAVCAGVPEAHVVKAHNGGLHHAGVRESEDVLRVLLVKLDVSNALQCLYPALHEAGSLGVVPKLVHKSLDMLLLALHALRLAALVADLLVQLLLEVVVGAAEGGQLAGLEVHDVRTHAVEEGPSMRYDENRLWPLDEVVLQP